MNWINWTLSYWMLAPWLIALMMACAVHLLIYFIGAGVGVYLTEQLWPRMGIGEKIDKQPAAPEQIRSEIKNAVVACLILGLVSMSYRGMCDGLWPTSGLQAIWQLAAFVVFNAVYAYGTHRLLHTRYLRRFHGVHHKSIRVTPWSGYSVHPVEAVVIAATLPLFTFIYPLGIGTVFVLHAVGMTFTTCIHCNYELFPHLPVQHRLRRLLADPAYHRFHHTLGKVNFAISARVLDQIFDTRLR